MDRQRKEYTFSGDSWMESNVEDIYFWGFLVTWDNILPISIENHDRNQKMSSKAPTIAVR